MFSKSVNPTYKAETCIGRMGRAGVPPDVITFNALIDAHGKNEVPEKA